MNPTRIAAWESYFRALAYEMGLKGWRYKVMDVPCDEGAGANFSGIQGKDEAEICLSAHWEDYEPEKQRQYAVHELVHSHFHQFDLWVLCTFRSFASPIEADRLYQTFDMMTEHTVERLAWALEKNLPLPSDVIPELGPLVAEIEPKPAKLRKSHKKEALSEVLSD